MSSREAPQEVVSTLFELFGRGRIEDTFELMHPEVVLHEPGDPEVLPWAGTHHGHAGLRAFYAGLADGLSEVVIDPETLVLRAVGDGQVLAVGSERGVAAGTGKAYHSESAWLWTVHGGLITELRAYHDTAAMHRAFEG